MVDATDALDKISLSGTELRQLNFINKVYSPHFRRHFRQGLRSHIFEILCKDDVERESNGVLIDGIMMYPRAVPKHMLRIMRTCFKGLNTVLREVEKYRILWNILVLSL